MFSLKKLAVIAILIPFIVVMRNVIAGSFPFWFDPARDFLLALDSLKKPTLIGPPTGITDVFYGPYWVWLLSIPLLFSKDPRFVLFFALTIPTVILFPIIFFKLFRKYLVVVSFMWLLFMESGILGKYATYIWNPHLAPLLYIAIVYVAVSFRTNQSEKTIRLKSLALGLLSALLVNFHFSFGSAILVSTFLYLFCWNIYYLKSVGLKIKKALFSLQSFGLFVLGVLIAFLPTIIFETRHGFFQTKALIKTSIDSFLLQKPTVGLTGLKGLHGEDKSEILHIFYSLAQNILQLQSQMLVYITLTTIILIVLLIVFKKLRFGIREKLLLLFLTLSTWIVLSVYIRARNPVWSYHFIGLDIVLLLFITLIVSKIKLFKYALIVWVLILAVGFIQNEYAAIISNPDSLPNLNTKQRILRSVYKDISRKPFDLAVHSPAIYTFDYDYLKIEMGTQYQFVPLDKTKEKIKYLIIPKTSEGIRTDFIHYKTPDKEYKTVKDWTILDGTVIIKREKLK